MFIRAFMRNMSVSAEARKVAAHTASAAKDGLTTAGGAPSSCVARGKRTNGPPGSWRKVGQSRSRM